MNTELPRRVTLRDIAAKAGLSVIAVSMALRDHPRISVATRQRVQNLARELGYRRDPMLSALSAYRRGGKRIASHLAFLTTGHSADDWRTRFDLQLFEGARQEAHRLGYELIQYWLDPSISDSRHSQILAARGFLGLLTGMVVERPQGLQLYWDRFCVVALSRHPALPALHHATTNRFHGMMLVCGKLQALGYQRIGLVMPAEWDHETEYEWSAALLKFQSLLRRAQRVKPLWDDVWSEDSFRHWLDKEKPDALIAYGDAHYWWAMNSGRQIPRDIGYVILSPEPRLSQHRDVTALDQNFAEVGRAGASLLHSQCISNHRGISPIRMVVEVDGTWHAGKTVRRQHGTRV